MSNLFDYKHEMSALQFTPAQKAQLVRSTAAAAAQKHPRKHRRPIFRTAVIAAAMAVALVAGSSAAGILPAPADVFAPLFGGTVAQTEVIDKIGHPIGASASSNGITITADAIIGDQYNACVVYTITRENGEPFEYEPNEWGYLGLVFEEGWIDIANTHGGSRNIGYHGSSGFIDPTPGDNSIQYFQQISSDTPLNTGNATADFKNLQAWGHSAEGEHNLLTLADGRWKLRFAMDYEDSAVYLANGETFSQNGLNFTIDEISVSPIAVRIAYTVDSTPVWSGSDSGQESDEDAREAARFMENVEVLLTKTDGTVLEIDSGGTVSPDAENNVAHCTKSNILNEIIPLEELASISVGGVVYEIPNA